MRAGIVLGVVAILCTLSACASPPSTVSGCGLVPPAPSESHSRIVSLHLDYVGADVFMRALEQDSLSEAEVDTLLSVQGVRAMVDNVTRFIPRLGVPEFRSEIGTFVSRKRAGEHVEFQLSHAWQERLRVRGLISAIRADESAIVGQALSLLEPYRPDIGPISVRVYLVAGGVSDGFVFEDDTSAFYINLVRAEGECHEVLANVVHEAYHVMQAAAARRSGTLTALRAEAEMPPVLRLLKGTLYEGTANLVADPARLSTEPGSLRTSRERYRRSAEPARIAENFAVFDSVMQGLRDGTITWQEASEKGFSRSPQNEDRFYAVGHEMAKIIERHCGQKCIGKLFEAAPVEFFRRYIALYREHPEIRWRFGEETERFIMSPGLISEAATLPAGVR